MNQITLPYKKIILFRDIKMHHKVLGKIASFLNNETLQDVFDMLSYMTDNYRSS